MPEYPALPDPATLVVDRQPWRGASSVYTVRGDRLHPVVSGNKWFKLKPFLEQCRLDQVETLVSVGGAFSNHLHALAFAGRQWGFSTVGIVRGPEPEHWSETLVDCQKWGMQLHFISRDDYRSRYSPAFAGYWAERFQNSRFLAEGGWSDAAIRGSALWWRLAGTDLGALVCPVGSGTTLAGIALSAPAGTRVIGVPVYRDPDDYADLHRRLREQGLSSSQYEIWAGWAGRGFGRLSSADEDFMREFAQSQGIQLDPVYTVKVFRAVTERLAVEPELKSLALGVLHTGGLQGLRPVER